MEAPRADLVAVDAREAVVRAREAAARARVAVETARGAVVRVVVAGVVVAKGEKAAAVLAELPGGRWLGGWRWGRRRF